MKATNLLGIICLGLTSFFFSCEPSEGGGEGGGAKPTPTDQFVPLAGQTGDIQFAYFDMEFGPVIDGDTVRAVYPFKNTSQKTVSIERVAVSCPCISAEYPTKNLAPGEVSDIRITFHTEGQAKTVRSTHEKLFPVFLKGEQFPLEESLKLHGVVMPKSQAGS